MKYILKWILMSLLILVGIPVLVALFVPFDSVMVFLLVAFVGVNPIFFALMGLSAGRDVGKHWYLPVIGLMVYILGIYLLGAPLTQVLVYAGVYLVVSIVTMILSAVAEARRG